MNSFDFRHVERAAGIPEQHRAGHFERRHRLIPAFDHGARAPAMMSPPVNSRLISG